MFPKRTFIYQIGECFNGKLNFFLWVESPNIHMYIQSMYTYATVIKRIVYTNFN